jgi:hypothetical protein
MSGIGFGIKGVELDNALGTVKTVYFCVFNVMALKRRPNVALLGPSLTGSSCFSKP